MDPTTSTYIFGHEHPEVKDEFGIFSRKFDLAHQNTLSGATRQPVTDAGDPPRHRVPPTKSGLIWREEVVFADVDRCGVRPDTRDVVQKVLLWFTERAYTYTGPFLHRKTRQWEVLRRGQAGFSSRQLANHLGVDRQRVKSALKILCRHGLITYKGGKAGSTATVTHFEEYYRSSRHVEMKSNPPVSAPPLRIPHKDYINNINCNKPSCRDFKLDSISDSQRKRFLKNRILWKRVNIYGVSSSGARRRSLEEVRKYFNGKIDTFRTAAALAEATGGRKKIALAVHLLTDPKYTPPDWAVDMARAEMQPRSCPQADKIGGLLSQFRYKPFEDKKMRIQAEDQLRERNLRTIEAWRREIKHFS